MLGIVVVPRSLAVAVFQPDQIEPAPGEGVVLLRDVRTESSAQLRTEDEKWGLAFARRLQLPTFKITAVACAKDGLTVRLPGSVEHRQPHDGCAGMKRRHLHLEEQIGGGLLPESP